MYKLGAYMLLAAMTLAALTLSGCGGQDSGAPFGTVRGIVTQVLDPSRSTDDPSNVGPALAQATVAVYALERQPDVPDMEVYTRGKIIQKAVTDAGGAFSFSLAKGKYVVEVWVEGYTMANRQVEVKGGQTTDLNFNVRAAP